VEILLCKIEYLRQEMYVAAPKKGIANQDVLIISQKLDEVINKFYKLDII